MKKLLFIDPHFSLRSPTLKSMLREFPACFDDFDEVEVWAFQSDFSHSKLKNDLIYCPFKSWHLASIYYWFFVHIRYVWRFWILKGERPTVIQATNYYCYGADLIYCQFSFLCYKKIVLNHKKLFRLSYVRWIVFYIHYVQEWILFKIAKPKTWFLVSRHMTDDCKNEAPAGSKFYVLPNAYDSQRFSHKVRNLHRNEMRSQLGFRDEEQVFIFVSLGDLERKGFCLAAQAVKNLVDRGHPARLLFVGGPSEKPMDLAAYLADYGIFDLGFLHCVGRVPDVEQYMSAADALLFPSYCEAFALVEIESAALGLRLYLTPHYGSEMILREEGNGRFIPWDAEGIADIIENDIRDGQFRQSNGDMGEALSREEFLSALRQRYQEILATIP
jgi:glycosyltransferase involved in cell wall biosynthesis